MKYDEKTHRWTGWKDDEHDKPRDGYLVACHMADGEDRHLFVEARSPKDVFDRLNRLIETDRPIVMTGDAGAINLLCVASFDL